MNELWKLFRYRPVSEFLLSEISNSEIYCAHPEALNDPFDCRVDWSAAFSRALTNQTISSKDENSLNLFEINFLSKTRTWKLESRALQSKRMIN